MSRTPLPELLAFGFSVVVFLFGTGIGCNAVWQPPPPPQGLPSCIDSASHITQATSGDRTYSFPPGEGVDAYGVAWSQSGNAVEVSDTGPGCWVGGTISGPYLPGVAVYECTSQHCPGGTCPSPCLDYHTTAGVQWDTDGPDLELEDLCIEHYGDGLSMYQDSGGAYLTGVHIHETLDDAIENDFCDADAAFLDSLAEDVAILMAPRLRGSASGDCTPRLWEVRDSLVKIKRPAYWYRQGDRGDDRAGSVFKLNPDCNNPDFAITNSTFVVDRPSNDGEELVPPLPTLVECEGNTVLLAGTPSENAEVLAEGDKCDGLSNGERLAALSDCYTVIARQVGETQQQFLDRTGWTTKVSQWKQNHIGRCP